jgi:alpha-tubulin suppressor-like RCC1 family protein
MRFGFLLVGLSLCWGCRASDQAVRNSVAATCSDGVVNQGEVDVDCGDPCTPCADGLTCGAAVDCLSGVCSQSVCQAVACDDATQNGDETDVDCGGVCAPCGDGQQCTQGSDCTSGVCDDAVCVPPACDDAVQNGDETGVDCGGNCSLCGAGAGCAQANECLSGVCRDGACQVPTCDDATLNGSETDIDCGGDCGPCALGAACIEQVDCGAGRCVESRCFSAVHRTLSGAEKTSCLLRDGVPYCMGFGGEGAVGDGGLEYRTTPTRVANLDDAIQLVGRYRGACALRSNGTVWCWGNGQFGQNGDNSTERRSTPVQVSGLDSVIEISGGIYHVCALKQDATVWCWGQGRFGQIGDGSTSNRLNPVEVTQDVAQLDIGGHQGCVLKQDESVWCWGYNLLGGLGNGEVTRTPSPRPTRVLNSDGFVELRSGTHHGCGRKADGTVWCWGRNANGQLGDGTRADRSSPVQMLDVDDAIRIAQPGYFMSCVLRADRTMWCTGENQRGQLGDGTMTDRTRLVQVVGLTNVTEMAEDGTSSSNLARTGDGRFWVWGDNRQFQLGLGHIRDTLTPQPLDRF